MEDKVIALTVGSSRAKALGFDKHDDLMLTDVRVKSRLVKNRETKTRDAVEFVVFTGNFVTTNLVGKREISKEYFPNLRVEGIPIGDFLDGQKINLPQGGILHCEPSENVFTDSKGVEKPTYPTSWNGVGKASFVPTNA